MDKRLEGSEEASAVVAGMLAACVGAGILAWERRLSISLCVSVRECVRDEKIRGAGG